MSIDRQLYTSFSENLLNDLKSLEELISQNKFETGITRLGAEQEFCTMGYDLEPAMINRAVLELLNDPHFTTELARYNLELNLDPMLLSDKCFSSMESELEHYLTRANRAAHTLGAKIILTGILPTIRHDHIVLDNMTPVPRYLGLNDAILEARGGDFKFHINGLDELITEGNSVLFESCNTSFQVHYQTDQEHAAHHYNWAHAITAPVLAACTNSPLFLGRRLWEETRIALFQQSADTRKLLDPVRDQRARVSFGNSWGTSALQIFRDTVQKHQILLPLETREDSREVLNNGGIPKLKALSVHNSTIYRWNRLCYGITEDKPHLRIENRYLPSGPSIVDEVANSAFWIGLMHGSEEYSDIHLRMDFDKVKLNFLSAAKDGLRTEFYWLNDRSVSASELILEELIPLARRGLGKAQVNSTDIDKYLGIIEERVRSRHTGSKWTLTSFNTLRQSHSREEAVLALTEGIYQRQKHGQPVHQWSELNISESGSWQQKFRRVEQIMTTDILTVRPDDLIQMAVNRMLWAGVHYIPVETASGDLAGLLSSDKLLSWYNRDPDHNDIKYVEDIMVREVLTCELTTPTREAFRLMKDHEIGCLPVMSKGKMAGMITIREYLKLMDNIFDEVI